MNDHLGTWTQDFSDVSCRLDLWDTGRTGEFGKSELRYALAFVPIPETDFSRKVVIIEGEDFHPSPLHAIDSDATAAALVSFMAYYGETSDEEATADLTESQRETLQRYSDELTMWEYELDPQ